MPAADREGVVRLDDGRVLGYREYGERDGAPIVYMHGMPGSRLDLALLEEEYRRLGVRAVALDRPGYLGRDQLALVGREAGVEQVDRLAVAVQAQRVDHRDRAGSRFPTGCCRRGCTAVLEAAWRAGGSRS